MAKNIDIPDGWERIEFGYVVNLRNKKYIPKSNENFKCIELECIEKESGNLLYYLNSNTQKSTKTFFYKDDVLYGKLRPYLKKYIYATEDGVCSSEIWVFHATKKMTSYFLFLIVQSNRFNQITNISTGTRMPRADWNVVSNFPILLPPLDEQKKIADILSLWDKAIQQTKELIAYKEIQKKGLMQNLLTGKKRLNGFNDDWKTIKLGEVAEMNSGGTPTSSKNEYYNGNIYWVSITDMTSSYKYLYDTNIKITELGLKNSSAKIFPANTVLFAMYASIGECIIAKKEISTSQAILGIRCNNNILYYEYLFYFLYNYKENYKKLAQQGTQANLNKEIVENFKLKIPTSIDEQKAIADILSKADEEINLLNKQLDLYTEQKKGLMQNLLTGKIRV